MAKLGEYLQTWKLKLSTTKTVSAVFHLNSKEAKRELKVSFNKESLTTDIFERLNFEQSFLNRFLKELLAKLHKK